MSTENSRKSNLYGFYLMVTACLIILLIALIDYEPKKEYKIKYSKLSDQLIEEIFEKPKENLLKHKKALCSMDYNDLIEKYDLNVVVNIDSYELKDVNKDYKFIFYLTSGYLSHGNEVLDILDPHIKLISLITTKNKHTSKKIYCKNLIVDNLVEIKNI